ncbi:phospholipase D-like domain-containing protein [Gordonia sp. HY002]|uniref:phospholipase D-like domain-containing protein n=1 Tax=Gordonia zhenghanii TaxID=2911516 RepID=UPI001EEFF0FD|nr:phospholipase D-like domain-containing protein [Gordonia zhenghanii]MCF8571058.1 phospholipase D-like domain-containing protein [Gordonia zhenghanii]MCF8606251.1 phospholipase D-like domain-containing protein [Gordonia zhenghanii]
MTESILVPGDTCRQTAKADRLSVIVDAADYFTHAKSALLQAQRRVILVGWDFDTRIELERDTTTPGVPDELGDLLSWLAKNRPDLEIFVLRWSIGALTGIARGMLPPVVQDAISGRRLHYRVDAAHPIAAAHHQKIAVIDDKLAFCGGIDMTVERWDTSDHATSNEYRVTPTGDPYGPWHDVTLALDGEAATAIATIAYDRWEAATGKRLDPITPDPAPVWPDELEPTLTTVTVGVSRTLPEYDGRDEVDEIRRLYLAAIASAQDTLYIESQYLASREIAGALITRLNEDDGPEIVVVLPRHADGDIERRSMDGARYRLLRDIWDADVHDRFRIFFPVTAEDESIYVHAKVLIADDRILRIGSSNLNNRSLGFDSECDVTIDAVDNDDQSATVRSAISAVRTRLIAEHLGVDAAAFDATLAERRSLVEAIDLLRGDGRTLEPFTRENTADEDSPLADNDLIDPEDVDAFRFERVYRAVLRRTVRGVRSLLPF